MNFSGSAQQAIGSLISRGNRPKWVEQAVVETLPNWTTLLLLLLVAYQAAAMTWQFIGEPLSHQQTQQQTATAVKTTRSEKRAQHGTQIANMHLFGIEGQAKRQKRVEAAPETRLKLTLHGVFVGKAADKGSAIIGKANGKQLFYKTGLSISRGAILKEVYADHVVLMRNGRREVLRFPKSSSKGVSVTNSSAKGGGETLKNFRDTFARQPLKIFQHLRFVPVRGQDGVKGFRVLPQGNRTLFNKLGVKSSDLVTAINGTPLTDERKALQLLGNLKNANEIVLDIVRKGVPTTISLNLN
ncbi:MAG: type II secretion system protein GspC [Candidatus Polarisedimenticolaceae bacterium]|nr:type II secretion system protein GspC [Candidatus Polarisedimenticolaceae bacterium]